MKRKKMKNRDFLDDGSVELKQNVINYSNLSSELSLMDLMKKNMNHLKKSFSTSSSLYFTVFYYCLSLSFLQVFAANTGEDESSSNSLTTLLPQQETKSPPPYYVDCYQLKIGQFKCDPFELNEETQQPVGCTVHNLAPVNCTLRRGLRCDERSRNLTIGSKSEQSDLERIQLAIPCQYTNNIHYEATLFLSICCGMFGLDRFYLGYPALGLLKLSTFGFLYIGQFVDIIWIALQVVRPADGSNYVIRYLGPRFTIINWLPDDVDNDGELMSNGGNLQQKPLFGLLNNIPLLKATMAAMNNNINNNQQNDIGYNYYYPLVTHSEFDLYFYPNFWNNSSLSSSTNSSPSTMYPFL